MGGTTPFFVVWVDDGNDRPPEDRLFRRRQRQQTPEFQQTYRKRSGLKALREFVIGRLSQNERQFGLAARVWPANRDSGRIIPPTFVPRDERAVESINTRFFERDRKRLVSVGSVTRKIRATTKCSRKVLDNHLPQSALTRNRLHA